MTSFTNVLRFKNNHIYNQLKKSSGSVKQLSNKYSLSTSWLYKIGRERYNKEWTGKQELPELVNNTNYETILKLVHNYADNSERPLTIKEIQKLLWTNDNIKLTKRQDMKILKVDGNFSYKIICGRPNNIDIESLKYARVYFSLLIAKEFSNNFLLVNIDETNINYKTKTNYSWWRRNTYKEF